MCNKNTAATTGAKPTKNEKAINKKRLLNKQPLLPVFVLFFWFEKAKPRQERVTNYFQKESFVENYGSVGWLRLLLLLFCGTPSQGKSI